MDVANELELFDYVQATVELIGSRLCKIVSDKPKASDYIIIEHRNINNGFVYGNKGTDRSMYQKFIMIKFSRQKVKKYRRIPMYLFQTGTWADRGLLRALFGQNP